MPLNVMTKNYLQVVLGLTPSFSLFYNANNRAKFRSDILILHSDFFIFTSSSTRKNVTYYVVHLWQ